MNIFGTNPVEIILEYPFLTDQGFEPVKFFLRPLLEKEERTARQAFFALTDAEREEKQFDYNVEFLATLSVKPPEGLPEFQYDSDLAGSIRSFLGKAKEDAMVVKIIEDAQTEYFRRTQPKVFFRGV